jgi:hypothetical protein
MHGTHASIEAPHMPLLGPHATGNPPRAPQATPTASRAALSPSRRPAALSTPRTPRPTSWAALSAIDDVVRDNCFNNTLDVHRAMASMGMDRALPVYAAAHWAGADPDVAATVLSGVRGAGYAIVQAAPDGGLPRELRALVEYEVALRSERFLGNSVSTFSALAILQRRHAGRWAGYYNGGDIPLVQVLPLFSTPWVFTFNSWSPAYEPMLKAAVNSAARAGLIAPHCIFAGDARAPIAAWMRARGVRVIHHEPAWRDALVALVRGHAAANIRESHLFASEHAVVGTWQRIDLPIVPWLDQYTYVLFTDTDVLFRRPFTFHEFPLPLPRAVGMGPEMVDMFPYNAGVMLANLPRLRESYEPFLAFILSNRNGLVFPGYGPGDQVGWGARAGGRGAFGGAACLLWSRCGNNTCGDLRDPHPHPPTPANRFSPAPRRQPDAPTPDPTPPHHLPPQGRLQPVL